MVTFSPLVPFGVGLLCVLVITIWQVIRKASNREDKAFGFAALMLVSLLDVVAFIGGFSIGWGISLLNIVLGLTLVILAKQYQLEILFASLISLLLALFMRGHFLPAHEILEVLLFIAGLGAMVQIVRKWTYRKEQHVRTTELVMVACLGFLSLLLGDKRELGLGFAVFVNVTSFLLAIFSRYHRWIFLLIGTGCLLWAINLLN